MAEEDFQTILNRLKGDVDTEIASKAILLNEAQEEAVAPTAPVDTGQAVFSAVLGLLPLAIGGAVSGRAGLKGGSVGGEKAATTYLGGLEKEAERERKRAEKEEENLFDVIEELNNTKQQLAMKELEQKGKLEQIAIKGALDPSGVKIINKIQGQGSKLLTDYVMERSSVLPSRLFKGERLLKVINKGLESGKLDEKEGAIGATLRNVTGWMFPDTVDAEIQRGILDIVVDELGRFKGNPTEEERAVIRKIQGGDFNVPIKTLQKITRNALEQTVMEFKGVQNMADQAGLTIPNISGVDTNSMIISMGLEPETMPDDALDQELESYLALEKVE